MESNEEVSDDPINDPLHEDTISVITLFYRIMMVKLLLTIAPSQGDLDLRFLQFRGACI